MRIPLLAEIKLKYAVIFAAVLLLGQQLEGTDLTFSVLCAAYILIFCLAFNAAGGFIYPSGSFVFFNGMLTSIVAITYKVLLGEPGQTHLHAPNTTMLVYCASMILLGLIAALTRRLAPRRGLLAGMGEGDVMRKAAVGCLLLGGLIQVLTFQAQDNGSILSAVRQVNNFTQLAIILGTFYEVKRTGGRASSNWIVWTAGLAIFAFNGLFGFSKQGLLVPGAAWITAAVAAGHRFSRMQLASIVAAGIIFQIYLVPFAQVGKNLREESSTIANDSRTAVTMLGNIGNIRRQYKVSEAEMSEDTDGIHYYDRSEGFMDRISMLAADDALIAYTQENQEEGYAPTIWAFANVVPHFLWKDKPYFFTGNLYAREIGMISEENDSTGISFSPESDAFHQLKWLGILLIMPPVIFMLFMVMDSLSGPISDSPWGLLFTVQCAHIASEGMIIGQVWTATYMAFGIIVAALLSKYVLPKFAGILTNTERTRVRMTPVLRPVIFPRSLRARPSVPPGSEGI